jgi:hypothetical protein
MRIEDYALVGDLPVRRHRRAGRQRRLALRRDSVRRRASRRSSATPGTGAGSWLLAPAVAMTGTSRRYRPGTLVRETDFETVQGA